LNADPTQHAIIEGVVEPAGAPLLQITADDVTAEGLTLQNNTSGLGVESFGSRTVLRSLVIQFNSIGAQLWGVPGLLMTQNCIRSNSAFGIFSGSGVVDARIDGNFLSRNGLHFIQATNVSISNNEFLEQSSIQVQIGANVAITSNTVLRGGQIAIGRRLRSQVVGAEISSNTVDGQNVAGPPLPVADAILVQGNPGVRTNVVIRDNTVANYIGNGIDVLADGVTVRGNSVANNRGSGIVLRASGTQTTGDTIDANVVTGNGTAGGDRTDGIRIDESFGAGTGVFGNVISNNALRGNVDHDCHESPLRENTWINNVGETENQPGLCRPASG
jgi:hypothetical protein